MACIDGRLDSSEAAVLATCVVNAVSDVDEIFDATWIVAVAAEALYLLMEVILKAGAWLRRSWRESPSTATCC